MTTPSMASQAVETSLPSALAPGDRPTRPSALSASLTFAWRALRKMRYVPEQLFDAVFQPIVFTLLFTYLFGGALAGSTGEYLQFVLPGILVYTVVFMTMYTGVNLNTDISRGVADRFRSLPVWRPAVIVGALIGDTVRYTLASTIVLALGLVLGYRPEGDVVGVLISLALVLAFSFSLSWIWTTLGLLMQTPNAVLWTSTLLMLPLAFASNIFVDPATMPSWLETAVGYNPITHLVSAVRDLMAGDMPGQSIAWLLGASAALVAVFAPLTMYLYEHRR